MREFYLRWAVKEAYTKALGVGMGLDFGSFEVRFDCCKEDGCGLVESFDMAKEGVEGQNTHRLSTLGKVVRCKGNDATTSDRGKEEIWHFTFTKLGGTKQSGVDVYNSTTSNKHKWEGCACVCVGPIASLEVAERNAIISPVDMKWMGLKDVFCWHKGTVSSR